MLPIKKATKVQNEKEKKKIWPKNVSRLEKEPKKMCIAVNE